MKITALYPSCPHCGRLFEPGAIWTGANYCRGLYLYPIIGQNPNLTAWELSQIANLTYPDTTRGLQKLRNFGALDFVAEERDGRGQRYRYTIKPNGEGLQHFKQALLRAAGGY